MVTLCSPPLCQVPWGLGGVGGLGVGVFRCSNRASRLLGGIA